MRYKSIILFVLLFTLVISSFPGCEFNKTSKDKNFYAGYYKISDSDGQKCLDGRNFTSEESKLLLWTEKENSKSQVWQFVKQNDGDFLIENLSTGKYLTLSDDGNSVIQNSENVTDFQKWEILEADGKIIIKSVKNGKAVDNMSSSQDGAPIVVRDMNGENSQLWVLEKQLIFDELASYYIEGSVKGEVLDLKERSFEYDVPLQTSKIEEKYSQQWFLVSLGEGLFNIRNLYSAKLLSVSENNVVVVAASTGDDSCKWLLEMEEDNYRIINSKNGEQLSVENNKVSTRPVENNGDANWNIFQVDSDYAVPTVKPVQSSDKMVGVIAWNWWNPVTRPDAWKNINNFPERTPVLGYYNDSNQKVIDWHIKMMAENGINFVGISWGRSNPGESPIKEEQGHWLEGYKKSEYKSYIKYALFVLYNDEKNFISDENDLFENLMPHWIENDFKDPDYLVIDGKPVITFYNSTVFINTLGGLENAKMAVIRMREMSKDAGFEGLTLLMAHHWGDINANHEMLNYIGIDGMYAYHVPTFGTGALDGSKETYTDNEIIDGHMKFWTAQHESSTLPTVLTASMGWDSTPWGGYVTNKKWRLTPENFGVVLQNAKNIISERGDRIDGKMVLIDNWSEFGEGHYIFPTEQYGFGYLDSIRSVFAEE